jgi:hypothetical protein
VKVVTSEETAADPCPTCRGRGWLIVRSRPVYRPEVLKIDIAELPHEELPRERCWDCGGGGRAAA